MDKMEEYTAPLDNRSLEHYTDGLREYIDSESTDRDIQEAIIDYTTEVIELQTEKKLFMEKWDKKLKECKDEATAKGVQVVRVNAVLDNVKRKLKQPEETYQEEASIYDLIVKNNLANSIKNTI